MLASAVLTVVALSSTVHMMGPSPPSPSCVELGGYLSTWQESLELRDWTVGYFCSPDPELGDTAEGSASIVAEERAALIHIHPGATDQEEIAAHELVHIWLSYVRDADSELVEEQAVRILTRLLVAGKRCEAGVDR